LGQKDHLHILWTNGDIETSRLMVLMYARNAMLDNWWKEVTVIVWGSTARLAAENPIIKADIKMAQHVKVKFSACLACARQLGVENELREMNIETKYWGEELTELIKNREMLLTV